MKLSAAPVDTVVQSSLWVKSLEQVHEQLMEMRNILSQVNLRDWELTVWYELQMRIAAELAQLRTQSTNKTAKTTELESVAMKSEQPADCA